MDSPEKDPPETADAAEPATLPFFYEKAHAFRVIHVDGAYGGVTPGGRHLAMSLYSERRPIPQLQEFVVGTDGALEQPARTTRIKPGIFREVEVCAIMDLAVARSLYNWLGAWINKADGGENERNNEGSTGR